MTTIPMTRTTAMTITATCPMLSSCSLLMGNPSVPLAAFSVVTPLAWVVVAAGFGSGTITFGWVIWGAAEVVLGFPGVGLGACVVADGGGTPGKQRSRKNYSHKTKFC